MNFCGIREYEALAKIRLSDFSKTRITTGLEKILWTLIEKCSVKEESFERNIF